MLPRHRLGALVLAALIGLAPAAAQTPAAPPGGSQPGQPSSADPFGQEVTLEARSMVAMSGTANWDAAFDTLTDALKSVQGYIQKERLKAAGPALVIYTSPDDTGFQYQAGIPIETPPQSRPRGDIGIVQTPAGKALKFVHRGSYDAMDNTYEAITNHLDDKRLEAKDLFIEEYVTDPLTTPEDKLVVHVFVPLK